MAINFNTDPYYDDFSESKEFYRILFKPGRAVQAREITQLQTTLQNQIARFGQNVFKEGAIAIPGQQIFDKFYNYVKLTDSYNSVASDDIITEISDFISKNLDSYTEIDYGFNKEVITRYSTTASFFEEKFKIDTSIYISPNVQKRLQIKELSKPLNYKQKFPNFSDIRRNDINLHIAIFSYYLQGLKIEKGANLQEKYQFVNNENIIFSRFTRRKEKWCG